MSKKSHLANDGDHISHLHESLLSDILSRLPTKDAVGTSILSKSWKYKWTSLYNVDIKDGWFTDRCDTSAFVKFVDRILLGCRHLRNLRLTCNFKYNLSCLTTWVDQIIRHHLVSIEIRCHVEGVIFPCSLLNSSFLRKLKLEMPCTLKVAPRTIVPNLTSLCLFTVQILNESSHTSTLSLSLPALETFEVIACQWLNVMSLEIYAPSLTTFTSETIYDVEEIGYSIVIFGARIVNYKCSGGVPENVIFDGSSVISAFLCCEGEVQSLQSLRNVGLQVRKLLNGFSSLKELTLSGFLAEDSFCTPFLIIT